MARPNHVCSTDITYIRLAQGFVYLVAIIDWYSRKALAWQVSNTMDASFCVDCLADALKGFGKPEIFNTDQGSQFTSEGWIKVCPECETIVHASLRQCPCGYEFPPPALKIDNKASNAAVLSRDYEPEWRAVSYCTYLRHPGKAGKPDTLRVDYWNDEGLFPVRIASEFICVFHPMGYARLQAEQWLKERKLPFNKK